MFGETDDLDRLVFSISGGFRCRFGKVPCRPMVIERQRLRGLFVCGFRGRVRRQVACRQRGARCQHEADALRVCHRVAHTRQTEPVKPFEDAASAIDGQGGQIDRNFEIRAFQWPHDGPAGPGVAALEQRRNAPFGIEPERV